MAFQRRGAEATGGVLRPLPTLPIVAEIEVRLAEPERKELARLAARLVADEPALGSTEPFGELVAPGALGGPSLVFGDAVALTRFEQRGDWSLEYRALMLAGEDDVVALGIRRNPAFEDYCCDVLGLGRPRVLAPRHTGQRAVASRCAADPRALDVLVDVARRHGGLNVVPYVGSGAVWSLAAQIAAGAGARVSVAAPPPRLTRRANDKLWFARRAREVLGARSTPPTYSAYGPAALAGRVARLAGQHEFVAVKVPDSAGSAGNLVMPAAALRSLDASELRDRLVTLLSRHAWLGGYPVLVSVWECPVLVSPSVQLWVPEREAGGPVVEGLFEQVIWGSEGEFVGAHPSGLPDRWKLRLATEAVYLAGLLQELGFYGRCSLDALLVGEQLASAELHWVECNARWGGVSIPLTLVNRLVGSWRSRPFVVVQRGGLRLPRRRFEWALAQLRDRLFGLARPGAGIVLLAPGGIEEGTGCDFLALAPDLEVARSEARAASDLLLGASTAG
jgi:hypothetical protein